MQRMRKFVSDCESTSEQNCENSSLIAESRLLRVGKETSAFLSTLNQRLSSVAGGFRALPCDVRDYRWDSRTDIGELEEAESLEDNGTPLLEVRRCGDGRPPVSKREREIRLNGISGVIFQKPGPKFRSGFFCWWIETRMTQC